MPTLEWIGKDKVINHHLDVPYQVLEEKYTFNKETPSENKIIKGDNLAALKSLLPEYEGKIKCIYIDPPYNTGNEGWCYNDNVNDPKIRKWLGQVVGKEGEDLSRHDKWLCMMYPRLKLLQKLLAEDGAIFISIDDNEQANLKLICDEIFGSGNLVAVIPWRKRTAKSDVPYGISQDCESIICYVKSEQFRGAVKGKERKYYETPDYPNRPWRIHDMTTQRTASERPNSFFTMINPKNGDEYPANPDATWRVTKETFSTYYSEGRIVFPGDYDFLKISKPVLRYWKEDDVKKADGSFGLVAASTYLPPEVGMTQDGTKEIIEIFGKKEFNFPKPSSLIQYLVGIATLTSPNSIILDSFSGSGTTAHAVLNLNKKDGGNRKFILVEMEDYAEEITAERVRRVIKGYSDVEGTGGDFTFCELGERLLDEDGNINEAVSTEKIRNYIWYMETHIKLPEKTQDSEYYLGTNADTAYYFAYEKDRLTELNYDLLSQLKVKADNYVIYADTCTLSESELLRYSISFRKIPRDIAKL